MKIRNITAIQLNQALSLTNDLYENNLEWNKYKQTGKTTFNVTLKVKNSHGKGARLGQQINKNGNRRHLINACWHAHGDFFNTLLQIAPQTIIQPAGEKIYKKPNGDIIGNWKDRNIGSIMEPLYYSEACECQRGYPP